MTTLLLDFRWDLDAIFCEPEVAAVVINFENLCRALQLSPAPFIEEQQFVEVWERQYGRSGQRHFLPWGAIHRFLDHCCRKVQEQCVARPNPEPQGVRDNWRRGLYDQMSNPAEWRNPQIIIPRACRSDWPSSDEVDVECDPCGQQLGSGPHARVIAVLEDYKSHRLANSDLDPWANLQWKYLPNPGARINNPCILPRPDTLKDIPLCDLFESLTEVRKRPWPDNGKYCYIPPAAWDPRGISKSGWRRGYAFPRQTVNGWLGPIFTDCRGIQWRWDMNERHWDVQTTPRIKVSHTGNLLA